MVKAVLNNCILCKKINNLAFRYPKVPEFISDKVNFTRPFLHTGLDYTGHMFVKLGDKVTKFYLLVFACLNVRAVHLELVPTMTTKDLLLAFIKLCNLYAIPNSIYSDNGCSFLQAMGILANSYSNNEFDDRLLKNNIKHVKIPLYSAWVGSAWERMIRTIKNCLHKVIGRKQLDYFELVSYFCCAKHNKF